MARSEPAAILILAAETEIPRVSAISLVGQSLFLPQLYNLSKVQTKTEDCSSEQFFSLALGIAVLGIFFEVVRFPGRPCLDVSVGEHQLAAIGQAAAATKSSLEWTGDHRV
jgi:hypothetical protein